MDAGRVRGGRQREPVLHSQVVESREAGEKLVAQLVKVRLRHGYVESAKTSTGRDSYDDPKPNRANAPDASPELAQAVAVESES